MKNLKRIFSFFAAASLVVSLFVIGVSASDNGADNEPNGILGDVNNDGQVNNVDAVAILKYDAGIETTFSNRIAPLELSEKVRSKINDAYLKFSNIDVDSLSELDRSAVEQALASWECLGTYGECIAVAGIYPFDVDAEIRCEEVAGLFLYYASDKDILVNMGDDFFSIEEAFEKGLITKDDVFAIGVHHGIAEENLGPVVYEKNIADMDGNYVVNNVDAARVLMIDAGL